MVLSKLTVPGRPAGFFFFFFFFEGGGGGGWSGGAMVLGKLPLPGRPTNLDKSRARAHCSCGRCGWGVVCTFFLSSIISLFFLPLFEKRPDID